MVALPTNNIGQKPSRLAACLVHLLGSVAVRADCPMAKKKKIRVDLRKNRAKPPRQRSWTRGFQEHGFEEHSPPGKETVRPKGDLSRRRTIIQDDQHASPTGAAPAAMPAVDPSACLRGRVLCTQGLLSIVETEDGKQFRCTVRRLLRTLATDERNIIATGDNVWFTPTPNSEVFIEKVEPRHGLLTRASRGKVQVLVANVDQLVIVSSLMEPALKPHLIDRYVASAVQGGIAPIICLNKADLIAPVQVQPLIGMYHQLGIPTHLTSAATGLGIDRLRPYLKGRQTVFSGQSGVGKSSLLNAIQPGLGLKVREVSETNQKGRHTTSTGQLIRLEMGGWVVDTPGIRQFQLWDIIPEEVEGFFAEVRPYVPLCGYPDCTHTHEDRCAVKKAVAQHRISSGRYTSYLGLFTGSQID
jgi:ribosome biogenesis GTPase